MSLIKKIYKKISKKSNKSNEFRWNFTLWLYIEYSWQIYMGIVWFCFLSQFFRPAIVCIGNDSNIDYEMAESLCFLESSFTDSHHDVDNDHNNVHHFNRIYYWLIPIMITMCLMFILPKTIWSRSKNCRCLQSAINNSIDSFGHHNRKQTIKILNKLNRITNNNNHHMTIIILFIHLWILISLPLMIGMFSWTMIPNTKSILIYGWEWIKFQSNNNNITIEEDPRQKLFPTIVPCTYRYYGNSGQLQRTELLCSIRFNLLLGRIVLFIWFYLFIMALLIIIELIKIILLSIPTIRSYYIQYRFLQNCRIKHIELDYSMILIIRMLPINIGHLNTIKLLIEIVHRKKNDEKVNGIQ
uniref:Innexin n=1 Tax=Dermatophagoides pteronyssinus TaxID=6956 RepID=A0A6P6XRT7_DERPT|nr:innexin shaking-B-like [Dermatophagoides pteronyssinus]